MSFATLAALSIHDVKNRLAAMAARAETRGDSDTVREALAAAGELSRLLACYKVDAGLLRPDIDARCPADLCDELIAETRPLTALEITQDARLAPTSWYYDESLIRMVLANAVHNAMRFARQHIHITARQVDKWLEFRVTDDGPGYPARMLSEPTQSAPISADGVGIGLYLAHQIAALHENHGICGRITLENSPGATFILRLPH